MLVTSIPPLTKSSLTDDENGVQAAQSRILRSFRASGFDVTSVNFAAEIESLRPRFPDVRFAPAEQTNAIIPDRYGPTIGSALEICAAHDACAIVNADIYLLESDIKERLRHSPECFYVARRLDVDEIGGDMIGVYERGIDAIFFVPERFTALIDDSSVGRFQFGAPFWDLVVPVVASFHGRVTFIAPPFILHRAHTPRFSKDDYGVLRKAAIRTVVRHAEAHAERSLPAREFLHLIDHHVGTRGDDLSRSSVRKMSKIFEFWVARLERESTAPAFAKVDDALSPQAARLLAEGLDDVNKASRGMDANDGSSSRRRWWQPGRSALRQLKRTRRERLFARLLASVGR